MQRASPLPVLIVLAAACGDGVLQFVGGPPIGFAQSYGVWTPGPRDDCTVEVHNSYSVVGPDRKVYPTWHPPVDPVTGCSFGHDHGRDPRGSALHRYVGPTPFGYANEQLDVYDPANPRHEDHFGHKIEWENDVPMRFGSAAAGSLFEIRCDVLAKLHQGSHSKDAFTNNLHELAYHIRCTDGTELHVTLLAAIGDPGQFDRSCDGSTVVVGPATPANSRPALGVRRRRARRRHQRKRDRQRTGPRVLVHRPVRQERPDGSVSGLDPPVHREDRQRARRSRRLRPDAGPEPRLRRPAGARPELTGPPGFTIGRLRGSTKPAGELISG